MRSRLPTTSAEPQHGGEREQDARPRRSRTAAPRRRPAARGTPRARAATAADRHAPSQPVDHVRSSAPAPAARSAAAMTASGIDLRQASEIARRADPLIARAAGQARRPAIGFGRDRGSPPRRRARRQRRPVDPDDRRRRRRGDVQRPGVAADEQPAAPDQRSQLVQVELAEVDDAAGRGGPSCGRAPRPRSGAAAARSDGPELSTTRRRWRCPRQRRDQSPRTPAPASAGTGCPR